MFPNLHLPYSHDEQAPPLLANFGDEYPTNKYEMTVGVPKKY